MRTVEQEMDAGALGLPPSVQEALGELVNATNPTTATYAKDDGVHVRVTAKAATEAEARALIGPVEAEARARLGDTVWGLDDQSLPGAILALVAGRGLTLATCDVDTGARLAALFGEDPAAPGHYRGGWVLGLEDAVALAGSSLDALEEVATILAGRVRDALGAGVGMTALAQISPTPDPATGRHAGGLVLATDIEGRQATRRHEFTSTRADLRRRAILWGAEFLRLQLLSGG